MGKGLEEGAESDKRKPVGQGKKKEVLTKHSESSVAFKQSSIFSTWNPQLKLSGPDSTSQHHHRFQPISLNE